jgi:hypothetical protein
MVAECELGELIVDDVEVIAGLNHLVALGTHLAHETFQDVCCIIPKLLYRWMFW